MDRDKILAQQLSNFQFWCEKRQFPPARVCALHEDRLLFVFTDAHGIWLDERFWPWNIKIRDHRPFGASTANRGWREPNVTVAVQVIEHHVEPELLTADAGGWARKELDRGAIGDPVELDGRLVYRFGEWDVDFYNPASGLLGILGHVLEFLVQRVPAAFGRERKIVSPFVVAKVWRRRGWDVPMVEG